MITYRIHQPCGAGPRCWFAAACLIFTLICASARADEGGKPLLVEKPIRVVVWDEQQPQQKQVYENFLGNAIADHLKTRPGLSVKSVRLADEEQGLGDDVLDNCDVLVWWGHMRNAEVTPETGKRIVERIKAGKLSLIALHSAHWSAPFVEAMRERTTQDALKALTPEQRAKAQISYVYPKRFAVPKRTDPLTPSVKQEAGPDGTIKLEITMPSCVFPAYRADGKPSHVKTLLPDHPIAAGIPKEFDVAQTEMYDEPFHVPTPDAVIFEEHWDQGEHFRSGCLWDVGKGKVFYFRPGHEIYPVYKQEAPLRIIENAVRYLGSELPK
ncbi:MAG: Trehalose utilization protein [Massilia sp.]|nr:Trehalose utilization protein [Massilia sp.]